MTKRLPLLLKAILMIALTGIFTLNTQAANFTVTTTADSGAGSLRAAVAAANATADADTIDFAIPAGDAGCTAGGVCTITLTSGDLFISPGFVSTGALTITNSTGANNLIISGNNTSRVFNVGVIGQATINGLTMTNGNAAGTNLSGQGGAIAVSGSLTITNSIIIGNVSPNNGGGIYVNSAGILSLTNSTVSDNIAAVNGGGIYNNFGTSTLTNSTVSGNTAAANNGGGIYNAGGGTLSLTNSTVSGNTARFGGGGICNVETLSLTNSTVSGNTANNGSGIFNFATLNLTSATVAYNNATGSGDGGGIFNLGTANLRSTIVARNTVTNASASPDFGGTVAAGSAYNLIGSGTGMNGITNGDAGQNQVGVDPLLDPTLQLNGGTTANHALLFGSPAIDKGNSFGLTTDQRGFARPVDNAVIANAAGGDGADIGAYETQFGPTVASVSVSGRVTTAAGRGVRNVQITMTDSQGNQRTAQTTAFGYYRFTDVAAGGTVTLSVKSRQFRFEQSTIIRTTNDSIADADFVAAP